MAAAKEKTDIKEYLLVGLIALLLIVSVFQYFQLSSIVSSQTTTLSSSAYDEMMADHHGSDSGNAGGMVGGC